VKNSNTILTDNLNAANEAVTQAIATLTAAATGYVEARKALVEGYTPEGGGIVQSTGVTINDGEKITAMVEGIDAAKAIVRTASPKGARGPQAGREQRYQLVNKADLSPVALPEGLDGLFANKVKKLRGPGYETAISNLSDVALIDTADGNKVVVDGSEMEFAPAPGRVAKAA
jgi:hypothetical protein